MGTKMRVMGQVTRYPRSMRDAMYPQLWERAVAMTKEALLHRCQQAGYIPVGPVHLTFRYAKSLPLDHRPDWASDDDKGPWYEEVDCAETDPDVSMIVILAEVPCA